MRSGEYVPDKEAVAAEMHLLAGKTLKGKLWVAVGKSLADTLNGTQPFVEFTEFGDDKICLLAKAHIVTAKPIDVPKSVPLHERRGAAGGDDPYQILGITPGTPWAAVRQSYFNLTKLYHPDRYISMDLPSEVMDYFGAKTRRINAAFAILEDTLKQTASTPETGTRAAV